MNPNSILAAKANAARFWKDPELVRKNIENRKSEKFKKTHTCDFLHTPEMQRRCTEAKRKSKVYQEHCRVVGAAVLRRPDVRAKAILGRKNSPREQERIQRMRGRWQENAAEHICSMHAGIKKSPICQKDSNHHGARTWHIRSPNNVEYSFRNLSEFIRSHRELFDPDDVPVRANRGIGMLRPNDTKKRVPGSWKGWTWISLREVFYNGGNDLLARPVPA